MGKIFATIITFLSISTMAEAKYYAFTSNGMNLQKYEEDFSTLHKEIQLNPTPALDPNNPNPPMTQMPWEILDLKANATHVYITLRNPNYYPGMPLTPEMPTAIPAQLKVFNAHNLDLVHSRDLDFQPMDRFDIHNNVVKIYYNATMIPQDPMNPNPHAMMGLHTLELTFAEDEAGRLTSTERDVSYDYSRIYFFNGNVIVDDLPQNPNQPYGPYFPGSNYGPNPGMLQKALSLDNAIYGIHENGGQKGIWRQGANNECQKHFHDMSTLMGPIQKFECSPNYIYAGDRERIQLLNPKNLSLQSEFPLFAQWLILSDINEYS